MTFKDTEWNKVDGSSSVLAIRRFPEMQLLDVEYTSGKYRYYEVDDVSALEEPESIGKIVRALVKDKKYERI